MTGAAGELSSASDGRASRRRLVVLRSPLGLGKQRRPRCIERGRDEREALHRGVCRPDFNALKPHTANAADGFLGQAQCQPSFADDLTDSSNKGVVDSFRHAHRACQ